MIPDLLTLVCDPNYSRESMRTPWIIGDWIYASDGAILVRYPKSELSPDEIADHRPNGRVPTRVGELFIDQQGESFPIPEILPPLVATCDVCEGRGYRFCNLGHEHDCCCDGGLALNRSPVAVGKAKFATLYLRRLRDAGFTSLCVAGPAEGATAEHDGIEVLLQPIVTKETDDD